MSLGYPKIKQKRRSDTLLRKYARELERKCNHSRRHYSQHLARSLALIIRELESDLGVFGSCLLLGLSSLLLLFFSCM